MQEVEPWSEPEGLPLPERRAVAYSLYAATFSQLPPKLFDIISSDPNVSFKDLSAQEYIRYFAHAFDQDQGRLTNYTLWASTELALTRLQKIAEPDPDPIPPHWVEQDSESFNPMGSVEIYKLMKEAAEKIAVSPLTVPYYLHSRLISGAHYFNYGSPLWYLG